MNAIPPAPAREVRANFDAALHALLAESWREGHEHGLRVAETIRGWLTAQPDSARQKRTREWADKAIAEARRKRP